VAHSLARKPTNARVCVGRRGREGGRGGVIEARCGLEMRCGGSWRGAVYKTWASGRPWPLRFEIEP
jgi:hypothetical protein